MKNTKKKIGSTHVFHPFFRDRAKANAQDFVARQKMGRVGTAEEIAGAVMFLSSKDVSNFSWGSLAFKMVFRSRL